MKYSLLIGGAAMLVLGATASFAETPATTQTPATQTAPATPGAPADTQTTATPPATGTQPPAGEPDPNEKICKKDETTGSRISKVCKTRKEWEDDKKNNSDF